MLEWHLPCRRLAYLLPKLFLYVCTPPVDSIFWTNTFSTFPIYFNICLFLNIRSFLQWELCFVINKNLQLCPLLPVSQHLYFCIFEIWTFLCLPALCQPIMYHAFITFVLYVLYFYWYSTVLCSPFSCLCSDNTLLCLHWYFFSCCELLSLIQHFVLT